MSGRAEPSSNMQNTLSASKQLAKQQTQSGELVEFEPKDDENCDTEAITKEEEWITKRKTELTTTRQIETRVKRQVVLEDGKVVEDTGPIVSTNTTEDTDKQETETTEKRDLGNPDNQLEVSAKAQGAIEDGPPGKLLAVNANVVTKLLPRPADGLVRESNEKRILSHEEVKDYLETEDVRHLGDFSDETYINAINNCADNLEETLLSATNKKQLVPAGPRVIANTSKSRKTIDTEDSQKRCFAQTDGTLVTENKKSTEHEIIVDEDLPEKDDHSTGSHERITTTEARQRFFKQRDEQNVDLLANGKVVSTEMRYAAETMQLEKDGSLERPGDWDSLSDRMRKLRKPQKTLLQQQKEAALMADRKDALTKRPLDFDREEETRKGETMKWLESHFGSESTASNDSREDTEVEPTKRTFFNVTIKSNHAQNEGSAPAPRHMANVHVKKPQDVEPHAGVGKTKYYQGISNWSERKNLTTNHFATKAFRDDLKETVERNRLKKGVVTSSREQLYNGHQHLADVKDTYVSREDILQQKRQSLSSQFLARSKRGSMDTLAMQKEAQDYESGSHTDIRFGVNEEQKRFPNSLNANTNVRLHNGNDLREPKPDFSALAARKLDFEHGRVRKSIVESDSYDNFTVPRYAYDTHMHKKDMRIPSPDPLQMKSQTLDRPTVPQRKRAVERKLRQQISAPPESTMVFDHRSERVEPPPDYSPPPRSRSASPQIDYIMSSDTRDGQTNALDSSNYTPHVATARKLNQRTRFAPVSLAPQAQPAQHLSRPKMSTQTTQTTPSTISSSTATSHKSTKVGQVIGNSLRKLVSKIRSASAERKFRMKSKSKSREQSPSTQTIDRTGSNAQSTTYQQYNLIDSHIGGQSNGHESASQDFAKQQAFNSANLGKVDANLCSGSMTLNREKSKTVKRTESTELYANQRDLESMVNPRQRYYLGEDPYSSTLYGKENMYNPGSVRKPNRDEDANYIRRNNRENAEKLEERAKEDRYTPNRNPPSHTLGRYQKSSQRLVGSTPNLSNDYRTAKTLPRKLADHPEYPPQQYHSSQVDGRTQYQTTTAYNGPAKPARTYTKALSRSKSFNLHGLNGNAENNPIYIEKLSGKQNTNPSYAHKRDAYTGASSKESSLLQSGLKSPSIVNLISRSQKDLTKIGSTEDENEEYSDKYVDRGNSRPYYNEHEKKKKTFLKGLHQQAPDLYKTLHGDEDYGHKVAHKYPLKPMHSLDSRSPIQINKDTASIVRGGVYDTERHASLAHKEKVHLYMDDHKRRGSGSTIIEVNRK